jgi:hypothetical protein
MLSRQPIGLSDALYRTTSSLATDPRDKIFAILGLSFDWKHFIPEPSYVNSKLEVFTALASAMLLSKEPLDLIYLRSANRRPDHELPSWVPDWTDLNDSIAHRQFDYIMACRSRPETLETDYEEYKLDISGHCLGVRGVIVDTIDGLGSSLTTDGKDTFAHEMSIATSPTVPYNLEDIPMIIYQTFLSAVLFSNANYESLDDIPEDLFRLWTIKSEQQLIKVEETIHSEELAKSICTWLAENRSFTLYGRTIESWMNSSNPLCNTNEAFPNEPRFIRAIQSQMRLLITEKGYLGWAHPQACKGDKIAVLVGCSSPVVLRACLEGYQIVGDACFSGQSIITLREMFSDEVQTIQIC